MSTPFTNRAHRVSWVIHKGPIPNGLCVLHRCDNRKCVRPSHLFLGTSADNMADMARKGRTAPPERHWRKTRPWLAAAANAKCCGENNYQAKLTDALVVEYRRRAAAGEPVYRMAIAAGLCPQTLYSAVSGETWKHIPL